MLKNNQFFSYNSGELGLALLKAFMMQRERGRRQEQTFFQGSGIVVGWELSRIEDKTSGGGRGGTILLGDALGLGITSGTSSLAIDCCGVLHQANSLAEGWL